ncbi:hypothetical protein ZWY2020_055539 [Hordeum vulgare]|nr:hypothetical protein ZWY2020_055539 [Hordeum vulgare]
METPAANSRRRSSRGSHGTVARSSKGRRKRGRGCHSLRGGGAAASSLSPLPGQSPAFLFVTGDPRLTARLQIGLPFLYNAPIQPSLCAQIWISTTRARKQLDADATTTLRLAVNCRHRLRPAVSPAYFGNAIQSAPMMATMTELASNDLRWATSRLNASLAALRSRGQGGGLGSASSSRRRAANRNKGMYPSVRARVHTKDK